MSDFKSPNTIVTELSEALTERDVKLVKDAINAPEGLFEEINDPIDFLVTIHGWKNHNPFKLDSALQKVRPDLIERARLLPWLSRLNTGDVCIDSEPISMKSFVEFLKNEISSKDWKRLLLTYGLAVRKINFVEVFDFCTEKKIIEYDLQNLKIALQSVKRDDLASRLASYQSLFSVMTESEFENEFKSEYQKTKTGDPILWKVELQKYSAKKFSKVQPVLGSSMSVSLKAEFIPLTIVNQSATGEEEGTERELDMLERFYRQDSIPNIDFIQMIRKYDPYYIKHVLKYNVRKDKHLFFEKPLEGQKIYIRESKKDSWCLIGNPGSGKTFLCSRIALMFGHNELAQFQFSLSLPCRNKEWHILESNRLEQEAPFSKQLIQQWLRLGMPVGEDWTEDLAEHIVKTDGKGLLLIIDSIDEFSKSVPIDQTLLCRLLQRKFLTSATILFTSRPGAWYDIESQVANVRINIHCKVLGFSPENRDLYVTTQLPEDKCKECFEMFYYYHELRLLCLVPVNASLIVSLFKSSSSVNIQSLTELYSYLTLHLIRRQLSRMGLDDYINLWRLLDLNEGVLSCLRAIGEVAYQGVARREMTSSTKFYLKIVGEGMRDSEWLGLVNVSMKTESGGVKTKVWSFSHLTIQEFVAAVWLHGTPWYDACLIARFAVASSETFALYRMVLRFLCGLLLESCLPILYIIFKHLIVTPLPYSKMSLNMQYRYVGNNTLFQYSDCVHFTNQFISISSFLVETNSPFLQVTHLLPADISFYIDDVIAPNDWLSFIKSLRLLKSIHLIHFSADHITSTDFKSLLEHLSSCTLEHLAIRFLRQYNIHRYVDVIRQSHLTTRTKISFDLNECDIEDIQWNYFLFSLSFNQCITSVQLLRNKIPKKVLENLIKQLNTLTVFSFHSERLSITEALDLNMKLDIPNFFHFTQICAKICADTPGQPLHDYPIILSAILTNTALQGLHLYKIPDYIFPKILHIIPSLGQLQEITCATPEASSIIPRLLSHKIPVEEKKSFRQKFQQKLQGLVFPTTSKRSQLTYLCIHNKSERMINENLLQLLEENLSSLLALELHFYNPLILNSLFASLHRCTALVSVKLKYIQHLSFASTDSIAELRLPQSLICFEMSNVELTDSGLLILVQTIAYHKALRYLKIFDCSLTSKSCIPLCNLISTLRQLRTLCVDKELSYSHYNINLLQQTADQFSIELGDYRLRHSRFDGDDDDDDDDDDISKIIDYY